MSFYEFILNSKAITEAEAATAVALHISHITYVCAKASSGCAMCIYAAAASISFRSPHFSCCYSSLSIVIASHVFYSIASNVVSDNKNNAHSYTSVSILSHSLSPSLSHIHPYEYTPSFSVPFSLFVPFRFLWFIRSFVHSSNTRCAITHTYAQIITSSQVFLFYFA